MEERNGQEPLPSGAGDGGEEQLDETVLLGTAGPVARAGPMPSPDRVSGPAWVFRLILLNLRCGPAWYRVQVHIESTQQAYSVAFHPAWSLASAESPLTDW